MVNVNIKYQQSIASEFIGYKDRVRLIIGDNHWDQDGIYKKQILMNYLRRVLPENVAVGTGFVKNQSNQLTDQIDIIVYKKNEPNLFSEGDLVILTPESVLGIIEVKSKITPKLLTDRRSMYGREIRSPIDKCHRNGEIIGRKDIFNGIFAYEKRMSFRGKIISKIVVDQLREKYGYINHICFDDNIFMRYLIGGNPIDRLKNDSSSYSFYDLSYQNVFQESDTTISGLAYGYFISSLLESVYKIVAPNVLNKQYFEFLYPLGNTKEAYKMTGCEIKI